MLEVLDGHLPADDVDGLLAGVRQDLLASLPVGLGLPQAEDPEDTALTVSAGGEALVSGLATDQGHDLLSQEGHSVVDVLGSIESDDTGVHVVLLPAGSPTLDGH